MKTSCNMLPSLVRGRPLIFMTLRANTCRVFKRKLPSVIRLPLTAAAVHSNADTLPFLSDTKMTLFETVRIWNSWSAKAERLRNLARRISQYDLISWTNNAGNVRKTQHWRTFLQPFCCRRAISIACCDCVFVNLVIQHAMRMRHIVICDLPRSTKVFYIISKTSRSLKKKSYWTQNVFSNLLYSVGL